MYMYVGWLYLLLPVAQLESVANGSALTTGLIQTVEGGVVTKRSSRIAGMSRKDVEGET